ncbi:UPF0220-domain-containing protein [Gloeopeniophorella convolvens]|nr:UPF0220-domain-containing protein [Gloeopeniophorella convolvens]
MSLPHSDYDQRSVCVSPPPFFNNITLGRHRHTTGVHFAGALVLFARPWTLLYAAMLSAHAHPPHGKPDYPVPMHASFTDWVLPPCALLGMLVTNLIDKDRARLILFSGFALMAGGLVGSIALPVLKYAIRSYRRYDGYSNVAADVSLMLPAAVL